MRRVLGFALAAGVCLAAVGGAASSAGRQDAGARARERAARFNKDKHKVKEKRGVRLEVFVEMRAEPAVRSAAEYSGEYVAEPDFHLELRVAADGSAEGSGREPGSGDVGDRRFTLRDARVSGALLDATKVYEDGRTERLEGVFINLTARHGKDDAGTTSFGLGVVYDPPKMGDGFEL